MSQKYAPYNPNQQSNNFKPRTTFFYLNTGSNVYRILPPFGSLRSVNKYHAYHNIFWVKGSAGKARPIASYDDKKHDVVDPITAKLKAVQAEIVELKKSNKPKDQALADAKSAALLNVRSDGSCYLNAMNLAGQFGVLKVNLSVLKALGVEFKKLFDAGFDPINFADGAGLYMDFTRSDKIDGKYVYGVIVHTKVSKDPVTKAIRSEWVQAPMTEELVARFENEATDLTTLFAPKSMEEHKMIATLDPTVIDRVFARPTSVTTGEGTTVTDEVEEDVELPPFVPKVAAQSAQAPVYPNTTAQAPVYPSPEVAPATQTAPRTTISSKDIMDRARKFAIGGEVKSNA